MCSKTPNPTDFETLVAAKNNLLLISVLGVFPQRRFNTYGTKDVIVFLFSKEVQYIIFFPKEIKNPLFFPRRSSISSFFQGGPVYHVFSQRRSSASSFSKEVQHIMFFSKKVTYISFFPKEIKYFFFSPRRSNISPVFSKEIQPLLVLIQEGTL